MSPVPSTLYARAAEVSRRCLTSTSRVISSSVTRARRLRLTAWYSTRLQEHARRPQPEEMRQIFARLGLDGDFWDPGADSFG